MKHLLLPGLAYNGAHLAASHLDLSRFDAGKDFDLSLVAEEIRVVNHRMDLVIFDLDGTLIDSKEDLSCAVNAARGHRGNDRDK